MKNGARNSSELAKLIITATSNLAYMLREGQLTVKCDSQISDSKRESYMRIKPSKLGEVNILKSLTATQPNNCVLEGFRRSLLEAIQEERRSTTKHIRPTTAAASEG